MKCLLCRTGASPTGVFPLARSHPQSQQDAVARNCSCTAVKVLTGWALAGPQHAVATLLPIGPPGSLGHAVSLQEGCTFNHLQLITNCWHGNQIKSMRAPNWRACRLGSRRRVAPTQWHVRCPAAQQAPNAAPEEEEGRKEESQSWLPQTNSADAGGPWTRGRTVNKHSVQLGRAPGKHANSTHVQSATQPAA